MERKIKIYVKLKEALDNSGLNQKELSQLTGIREATISEIANNTRSTINKVHLSKIMDVLNINEIDEILAISIE